MEQKTTAYHVPVLLKESIDGLNIQPTGTYIDLTFGGGGHSREILSRLGPKGRLFSFDQDPDAETNTLAHDPRFTFIRSNFRFLTNFLHYHHIHQPDGILADLGVSSHHFDDHTRGFSFRFDSPLDMRMNKRSGITAAEILNTYDEEPLSNLFHHYGELRNARKIAALIVKTRRETPIKTTGDFLTTINPLFAHEREKKELAKVFQALRMEVNQEPQTLNEMLVSAGQALNQGGRLVVITYHSLEDRPVKDYIKTGNTHGTITEDFFGNRQTIFKQINNKVITPSPEETRQNPRSRSAKLRIAEKK